MWKRSATEASRCWTWQLRKVEVFISLANSIILCARTIIAMATVAMDFITWIAYAFSLAEDDCEAISQVVISGFDRKNWS